jgi:hypothetical protein
MTAIIETFELYSGRRRALPPKKPSLLRTLYACAQTSKQASRKYHFVAAHRRHTTRRYSAELLGVSKDDD